MKQSRFALLFTTVLFHCAGACDGPGHAHLRNLVETKRFLKKHAHDARPINFSRCDTDEPTEEEILESTIIVDTWKSTTNSSHNRRMQESGSVVTTVPTTIHVIRNTDGEGATVGQVEDQLRILNNAYGPQFQFEVVNTTFTVSDQWWNITKDTDVEMEVKTALRQGGPEMLNLYITDARALGWSSSPRTYARNPSYDGVMIAHISLPGTVLPPDHWAYFYSEGLTAVHEIGHWLGLFHTFQGGCKGQGDGVDDTPAEAMPSLECEVGRDTCTGVHDDGPDPIHNFMDYSYDACMSHFTPGQFDRMHAHWERYRESQDTAIIANTGRDPNKARGVIPFEKGGKGKGNGKA